MKNSLLIVSLLFLFQCTPKTDAWEAFTKCATNACIKEAVDVKDAYLNDPKAMLSQFQSTYEKGEDHVIGWLYMFRDSVLLNPKYGTVDERLAMQKAIIDAAKPFEKDPKVHEMAESVINELKIVDIKAGKINDPMAAASGNCYQFKQDGETMSCQLEATEDGSMTGFYSWYIEGKDGTLGILKSKSGFGTDTLYFAHKYMQEGTVNTEDLIFVKQGENLINLVSDDYDNEGRMILSDKSKLKAGNSLKTVDCATISADIQAVKETEKELK